MKLIFLILLIVGLIGLTECSIFKTDGNVSYGRAKKWQNYIPNPKGIYIEVRFAELNLSNPPFVTTSLTCDSNCWTLAGTSNIYNLTNKSFRVYLFKINANWTTLKAASVNLVLNYKIESLD